MTKDDGQKQRDRGRPRISAQARNDSHRRVDEIQTWIATSPDWSVKRLAAVIKMSREALTHILSKRVFCTPELHRAVAEKMGRQPPMPEPLLELEDDLIRVLDLVAAHPALIALSDQQRHRLAFRLAAFFKNEGLAVKDLSDQEINPHLMSQLAGLLVSHWDVVASPSNEVVHEEAHQR